MALRLPIQFTAEYRGARPGGKFTDRKTGELVDYGPALKFEYEDEEGDVIIVPIRATDLDKCEPPIDHEQLRKGDTLVLSGFVMLADRGSGKDSYFSIVSAVMAGGDVKPLKAATS